MVREVPASRRRSRASQGGSQTQRTNDHHDDSQSTSSGLTANPRQRKSLRRSDASDRCCRCTYDRKCSSDPRTNCDCRKAGRECWNCNCRVCFNRPARDECATPPPGDNSYCRPTANNQAEPAANRRPPNRSSRTNASYAESPVSPADEDATFAPDSPAQETSDDGSSTARNNNNQRTPTDNSNASGAGIGAFPDLSQESGQSDRAEAEDDGEESDGDLPTGAEFDGAEGEGDATNTTQEEGDGADDDDSAEDPEKWTDLASQVLTDCDRKLIAVFGDTTHRNDGRHLNGGIDDDLVWQRRYDKVVANSHRLYSPPKGNVGKDVVRTFAEELKGVRERKWNSERPLCFIACVLRHRQGCTQSKDIRRRINNRLALWKAGKFDALIQDITATALARAGSGGRPDEDLESVARAFNSQVLDGKLKSAVRNLTIGERGGVLGPEDLCTKTGQPVIDVLQSKHPAQVRI